MRYLKRAIYIASAALCFNLSALSQDITLKANDVTVKEAIEQLKKTTGYSFVFSSVDVNTKKRVSLSLEDATIEEVIKQILQGQSGLSYEVQGKKIVIKKAPVSQPSMQQGKVSGQIIDATGEPVMGATVREQGTSNGTVTDMDGHFTLDVASDATLEVSYIGYQTQLVKAQPGKLLAVTLKEDTQLLDEVVVIGYGTTTRKDFTGSVSSLKLEDSPISLVSNTNALESLKGTVSGLDIGATNTAGGQPSMLVRGQTSISGNNEPLLIVDGVIFLGTFNDINPNDIASIDVLKDATSAAAYGSRSANGVISITTKRGKLGKPIINFNATGSMQTWHRRPELMEGARYLNMVRDKNKLNDYSFLSDQQKLNYENGLETDWLDASTRTGWMQDYQMSVAGAGEKMNYYLSTSYTDNEGIVVGDEFSRLTVMGKIDTEITDWLKVGVTASYTHADYSGVGADLSRAVLLTPYDMMYRDEAGTLLEKYPTGQNEFINALWGVDSDNLDDTDWRNNFRVNSFAVVKVPWIKGLSYRLNYSGTFELKQTGQFYHENYYAPMGPYNDADRYSIATQQNYLATANGFNRNEKTTTWVIDHILNYKNTFGKHTVDLTAVATRDSKMYKDEKISGTDFSSNGNTSLGINGIHYANIQKSYYNIVRYRNAGYFARASYSFDDAWYLTASYRRDGASVFGADNKWGNFFAFGGAWRITHEKFMEKLGILNDMKLKLSWGRNGNQGISPYGTLSTVAVGSSGGVIYPFGNTSLPSYGIKQSALGNSGLGWETTDSWNFGFESVWFNHRLFADIDVYLSRTSDQIFTRTIPVMSGFTSMKSSMGEVANRGMEITFESVNIQDKDWKWNTRVSVWLNRNTLLHLYGDDMNADGKEDDDIGNNLFIGHSIHSIYGYKQDGIVQKEDVEYMKANGVQAGTPKYVDTDGSGDITVADRTIVGNSDPRFKMSLSNTVTWKNWSMYFMLTGTFGGNGYCQSSNKPVFMANGGGGGAYSNNMYVPYWTEDHPNNRYPAAWYTGDDYFLGLQSRAFVRLQDVTLAYTFNQPKIKDFGIQSMKVFFTGKNLFTITGWKGGDPELGNTLLSGTWPVATTLSIGANLSF